MEPDLLDSLTSRLQELEDKVASYRIELVTEFENYYNHLLDVRNTSPGVASDIRQSIAATFPNYPNLRPELRPADSLPPVSPKTATTFQSSAPTAYSGRPDIAESTRDRDHELQGLFTPSYLGLLDSSSEPAGSDLVTTSGTSDTPPSTASLPDTGSQITATQGDDVDMDTHAASNTLQGRSLPPLQIGDGDSSDNAAAHARADDGNSTADSDKSDSRVIRSALRRSSSTSKTPQSPRRVRFEVMGAEVLPTASPQPATYISPRPESPAGEGFNSDSIFGDDIDNEPPPRKVSSSDALRALSRAPLKEDGTVWTVVNADEETVSQPQDPTEQSIALPHRQSSKASGSSQLSQELNSSKSRVKSPPLDEVAMAKARSKSIFSPGVAEAAKAKEKKQQQQQQADDHDDHDDMFQFESGSGTNTPTRAPSPPPAREEDDEGEDVVDSNEVLLSSSATSHSVSISKKPPTGPTSPTTPKFPVGSIGSYKGRPVMMPVVKDAALHARAESAGDFSSFVGGLDGSSGMDPADLSSYRASIATGGIVGTPRSFTERLMIEEMQAERERQQAESR